MPQSSNAGKDAYGLNGWTFTESGVLRVEQLSIMIASAEKVVDAEPTEMHRRGLSNLRGQRRALYSKAAKRYLAEHAVSATAV